MNSSSKGSDMRPEIHDAGEREAGVRCARCNSEIHFGDKTARCKKCGGIHHLTCWMTHQSCGSYECSQGVMSNQVASTALIVSRDDLDHAEPLPLIQSYTENSLAISEKPRVLWNKLAVWAFIVALIGIPLFGIITGLVAMILACIALVSHPSHKKGLAYAVAGLLIGFFEIIGWSAGLYYFTGNPRATSIALSEYAFDPSSIENLPEDLKRAMRSNVLVEVNNGLLSQGMGSGVVLTTKGGNALIVTNRHVIDPDYNGTAENAPPDLDQYGSITVRTIGQIPIKGKIEWIAPHGIDLALISAPLSKEIVSEAFWEKNKVPFIGSRVFAIGNPHALGWTHSSGSISQYRKQTKGAFTYQIIQTTTPLNPGNSGGGLYDENGTLIGINTMTGDKKVAEGLGFAISINAFLDLVPNTFQIPLRQGRIEKHDVDEFNQKTNVQGSR